MSDSTSLGESGREVSREALERRLSAAWPRLVRLARARGLAPELADEAAQEVLIEAWRHIATLRDPARFDAWLDGICRNICRRVGRARAQRKAHIAQLTGELGEEVGPEEGALDLADLAQPDLAEELCRAELQTLVDHALGALPDAVREVVTLHYLEELPQREVALRLGLTISALEARLHRARAELRRVLAGELREEAWALGLPVGEMEAAEGEWRPTSLWCNVCGKRKLVGHFGPGVTGDVAMRLRCPGCSPTLGDVCNSAGIISIGKLRSFRPAFKRLLAVKHAYYAHWRATGGIRCMLCGGPGSITIRPPTHAAPYFERAALIEECPRCGTFGSWAATALWFEPVAQSFMAEHPRWCMASDALVSYQGGTALRLALMDTVSVARLSLFARPETLSILGAASE